MEAVHTIELASWLSNVNIIRYHLEHSTRGKTRQYKMPIEIKQTGNKSGTAETFNDYITTNSLLCYLKE